MSSYRVFMTSKLARETIILMLGAPGVGKGTYSRMLSKDLNLSELSTGDELRLLVKQNNSADPTIESINSIMKAGKLVDDKYMIDLVKDRIKREKYSRGMILDGFPRNLTQAKEFGNIKWMNLVVKIKLEEEILVRKLLGRRVCVNCGKGYNVCNIQEGEYDMEPLLPEKNADKCDVCDGMLVKRSDDVESVIRERIRLYEEMTQPLEEYYADKMVTFEPKKGIKDYPILLKTVLDNLKL